MSESVLQCPPFPKISVKHTTRQQHPLSAQRCSMRFHVSVTSCLTVLFIEMGLNISDEACFYTQNCMHVHKVYSTDSMILPTATFPDSILISFMLDMGKKYPTWLIRVSWISVLFFLLKPLPATVYPSGAETNKTHYQNVSIVTRFRMEKTRAWNLHFLQRMEFL
jgi:hypothetical protein